MKNQSKTSIQNFLQAAKTTEQLVSKKELKSIKGGVGIFIIGALGLNP